jgi:hypothetical protein
MGLFDGSGGLGALAGATPWGAGASAAADVIKGFAAGPAGPSQSGNIGDFSGGLGPVSIAGGKASANAAMGTFAIPPWVWIALAAVAVLYAVRKK